MTAEHQRTVKVLSNEIIGPDTHLIILDYKKNNAPGQFVELGINGVGEAPISIASYKRKYELIIRKTGRITDLICKAKKGDKLTVRGPLGRGYPMDKLEGHNLLIIAGGTGTAPPRGVIQYVEKNRDKFKQVKICYGFKNPECVLLGDEIKRFQKEFDTILSVDTAPAGYSGKTGFVTEAVKQETMLPDTKIIVCGPPVMMNKVCEILLQKNVSEEDIYISHERHMKCGIGKCGHCYVGGRYICIDGPVFTYKEGKRLID